MTTRYTVLLLVLALVPMGCRSEQGSALYEAIDSEDLEAVEVLISQGANVNERFWFQGSLATPMQIALKKLSVANEANEAIALAMIEAGGNPNIAWGVGSTSEGEPGESMYALSIVARSGRLGVVEALIEAGANVEGSEQGGKAMIAAAGANRVEVLRVLLDAGADMSYKGDAGNTPLGAAVEAKAHEAIAFLEDRGASEW